MDQSKDLDPRQKVDVAGKDKLLLEPKSLWDRHYCRQPSDLELVKEALVKVGIEGMTITGTKSFGRQKGRSLAFLGLLDLEGKPFMIDFGPKVRIKTVVDDDMVELVVDTIVATAKTGTIDDGKLFVIPVSRAVQIRTGEENETALKIEEPAKLSDPCKK